MNFHQDLLVCANTLSIMLKVQILHQLELPNLSVARTDSDQLSSVLQSLEDGQLSEVSVSWLMSLQSVLPILVRRLLLSHHTMREIERDKQDILLKIQQVFTTRTTFQLILAVESLSEFMRVMLKESQLYSFTTVISSHLHIQMPNQTISSNKLLSSVKPVLNIAARDKRFLQSV